MNKYTIVLFGEAEKGQFHTPYLCQSLVQLDEYFGNPPEESQGLFYAVQGILFQRDVIFFRVSEEGYSVEDYLLGIKTLENTQMIKHIAAICIPGVGDAGIINAISPICHAYHSILITSEADFYDYLNG